MKKPRTEKQELAMQNRIANEKERVKKENYKVDKFRAFCSSDKLLVRLWI